MTKTRQFLLYIFLIASFLISNTGFSQADNFPGTLLEFDGNDDYVELTEVTAFGFDESFTIEAWIKPQEMSEGYHAIASKGTEWQLKMFVSPVFIVFEFGINNNSVFSTMNMDLVDVENEWVHVAGVINQETGSKSTLIYINGNAGVQETANSITSTSTPLKIGEDFKGEIDEFRIWNEARTVSQIRENIHLTSNISDANLNTYIQFNDGSGSTAIDVAGGNKGTLNYMTIPDCWVSSGVPAGGGTSNTQTETTGEVIFTGTGLTANFNSQNGALVIVTKLNNPPNLNPGLFDEQYWFVDRYGSGSLDVDLTFTVAETLTAEDEQNPERIKLYTREHNSDTHWEFVHSALEVNEINKTAKFNNVGEVGQFSISRRTPPDNFAGSTLMPYTEGDCMRVAHTSGLDIENNLTIEVWIYAMSLTHNRDLLRKGNIRYLFWDEDFESIFGKGIQLNLPGIGTGWWEFQQDMEYAKWYHVAFTYADGGELKAYVDGHNTRTGNFPGNITLNTEDMILSSQHYDMPFWGKVDELRIWNVVRTQEEIRETMHKTLSGLETGLVSYWQFNEGSGSVAEDNISGYNGELINIDNSNWVVSAAPLPFIAAHNGIWEDNDTWFQAQKFPCDPWARVKIESDVSLTSNKELTDLLIQSNGKLIVQPQIQLTVSDSLSNLSGNDGFVLEADNTGMASLLHDAPNIPATVESYISEDQWHLVSSPVKDAQSNVFNDIYLKWFSEPDSSWNYIEPLNYPLVSGKGFAAWSYSTSTGNAIVNYSGKLNSTDTPLSLKYTSAATHEGKGWNLVGNPFPSAIDWQNNWNQVNLDNTIYVYDGVQYQTWNHNDGGTGFGTKDNDDIPVGQGFWVKANNSSPSLTIPQTNRKHSSQEFYKNGDELENLLTFTIEGNDYADAMIIYFNDLATANFDPDWDAWKMRGISEAPQIFSVAGEIELAVNILPNVVENTVVPIGLEVGNENIYTIMVSDFEYFDGNVDIYLEDLHENQFIDLKQISAYSFTSNPFDEINRFLLHFNNNSNDGIKVDNKPTHVYAYGRNIYISKQSSDKAQITVYNIAGQAILKNSIYESLSTIAIPGSGKIYLVEIVTAGSINITKVFIK